MPKGIYVRKKGIWPSIPRKLKYEIDSQTGCWNTLKSVKSSGYPSHLRQEYIKQKGEIPIGLQLDHLCRNRRCINAEHLEPVTPAENMHRSSLCKLNWEKVNKIRELASKIKQKQLIHLFQISRSQIYRIIHNQRWICH